MIVSFTAISQSYLNDSTVLVPVSQLRRASELILEGKLCQDNEVVLNALIGNKDVQISELKTIGVYKDSMLVNTDQMLVNKDSIIINKSEIIQEQKKKIRRSLLINIASVVVLILIIL
jgi:hypothetical protein